jgi:hypothetical protein
MPVASVRDSSDLRAPFTVERIVSKRITRPSTYADVLVDGSSSMRKPRSKMVSFVPCRRLTRIWAAALL